MKWIFGLLLLVTSPSWASALRILDGQEITNGAAVLTLPTSTDTLTGRATTDTLTNKTISGSANTITNLSASSITSGLCSVANGCTGLSTATSHYTLVGAGTSALSLIAPSSTIGWVYTSNGVSADPSFQAPSTAPPTLNATASSGQAITASVALSLSMPTYSNIIWVAGSGGPVTVTATPSITTAGVSTGARLLVVGTSNTNTVSLQDEASLSGTKLQLNGPWVGALYSTLELNFDGTYWVEVARR